MIILKKLIKSDKGKHSMYKSWYVNIERYEEEPVLTFSYAMKYTWMSFICVHSISNKDLEWFKFQ